MMKLILKKKAERPGRKDTKMKRARKLNDNGREERNKKSKRRNEWEENKKNETPKGRRRKKVRRNYKRLRQNNR